MGWVIWRHSVHLPQELVFNINYLGANQASFTLNFSKGASQVIAQYYQLIRFGKQGYQAIMTNLVRIADYLTASLKQMGFIIMSKRSGQGLPLVAFRLDPQLHKHYDEFALAHQLRSRSWIVPAYTMAPKTECLKMLRVVVREDFSKSRCDQLVSDVRLCVEMLDKTDKADIEKSQKTLQAHVINSWKATHSLAQYKNEKHSLQAKTGKTPIIC